MTSIFVVLSCLASISFIAANPYPPKEDLTQDTTQDAYPPKEDLTEEATEDAEDTTEDTFVFPSNNDYSPSTKYSSPNTCRCSSASSYDYRIVGGSSVSSYSSYPYQALFYIAGYSCGATILNKRYLLSAMHCIQGQDGRALYPSQALILVGTTKFSVTGGGKVLKVAEFIKHPGYVKATMTNDILLIKVKEQMEFSERVLPACLPTNRGDKFVGREATVTGWGATVSYELIPPHDLTYPNTLKHTKVKVLDSKERRCAKDTLRDSITKLCAYRSGTDACQGDSGGPLTVVEGGVHTIIGVVSYGFGCAAKNHPGIYTRVTNYVSWIVANIVDGRC